jgi:CHAT domain-containing protein/tetratricopeptide (TPR) repeat protein
VCLGCARSRNPQVEFEQARQVFLRGDLIRAQDDADSAWRYYSGRDSLWAWKFRVLDARVLTWRGMYSEVFSILKPEFPASLKNTDLDFERREMEGLAYARMHRFTDAESVLAELERDCLTSGSEVIGEVLTAEGSLQVERGEYEGAQTLFEKILQLARQRNDRFLEAVALMKLSNTALLREHFEEAINWSDAAYSAGKALDARLIMEIVEGNLGWAYFKMGDSERSSSLYLEAYKHAQELGDLFDEVKWLTTTGYIYFDAGDLGAAEASYQRALDLARKISAKENISDALLSLAFVTVQTGELDLAKKYSDEAIAMAQADGNRVDELYPLIASGQIAARQHDVTQAERIFLEVANDPKVDPSLKWEAQHELANLYVGEHRFVEADRTYRTTLATFEAARSSLQHEYARLPFLSNANSLYSDYIHFLMDQRRTVEALEQADYSRARTLAEGLGLLRKTSSAAPGSMNLQEVARDAHATILFYWLGPERSYLWALTPTRTGVFELPPRTTIDAAVERYNKALIGPLDPVETANAYGRNLYATLVGPTARLIPPGSKVIVIPDGSLDKLNFETLIAPEPMLHYWIEDVTITNASSLRLLAVAHGSPSARAGKLLLIGDAVAPNREYGELPEAGREMEKIEKHFAPAERQVYARTQATAPAYLGSNPQQFIYIHFVAHGTASRLSPLDSAVILSKASGDEDSFKLYARDIIDRPLHAELVTISTCYGSGVRAYTGEGLVGLSWAFLRAGAHHVIGALWEVSDTSTPGLMDELYGELKKGRRPEVALRSAKLSLLHSPGVFRKPFYWAPFQLYIGS